jgi:hypothetical protein
MTAARAFDLAALRQALLAAWATIAGQPGAGRYDLSEAGFVRAFTAALLTLPLALAANAAARHGSGPLAGARNAYEAPWAGGIPADILAHGLYWVAVPLACLAIARFLELERRGSAFVIVWCWTGVYVFALLAVWGLLSVPLLPVSVSAALGLGALGAIVWIRSITARVILGVKPALALLFGGLDLGLAVLAGALAHTLLG